MSLAVVFASSIETCLTVLVSIGRDDTSKQLAHSWVNPMIHTNHTTVNHTRQPVETIVRSMKTSFVLMS